MMALRRLVMAERVCVDAAASTTTGLLELAVVATLNHRRRVHVSSGHSAASTRAVDLRSDTITTPTPGMRTAIANAIVGDDVYGEDPTVARLEVEMARLTGKECGMFVPTGTMGNLASIAAHCGRGDEVVLGDKQHIFKYEGGGASALLGVSFHTVPNRADGTMDLARIRAAIRPDDPHYPRTAAVCLENTLGGRVLPVEYIDAVGALCKQHGLRCHLDGARIFNASVAAGLSVERLLRGVDTASICLSKGLGCPVGSVVVGSAKFMRLARRARKVLGGGMRQAGVLAAAGLYALEHHVPRLHQDHENAKRLAEGLAQTPGIAVNYSPETDTNIVIFELVDWGRGTVNEFVEALRRCGVMIGAYGEPGSSVVRAVVHQHVSSDDVAFVVNAIRSVMLAPAKNK